MREHQPPYSLSSFPLHLPRLCWSRERSWTDWRAAAPSDEAKHNQKCVLRNRPAAAQIRGVLFVCGAKDAGHIRQHHDDPRLRRYHFSFLDLSCLSRPLPQLPQRLLSPSQAVHKLPPDHPEPATAELLFVAVVLVLTPNKRSSGSGLLSLGAQGDPTCTETAGLDITPSFILKYVRSTRLAEPHQCGSVAELSRVQA